MDTLLTLATLAAAIRLAIPVAVAALGELVAERAGVLNLGLEGTMLFGALAGYLATLSGGTPWLGLGAGVLAGAACGGVLALLVVLVRADQIVTGLAFTLFAISATTYLFELSYTIGQAPPRIPSLSMVPLVVIVLVVLAGVWFVLGRTTAGLVLSAAGEAPEAVDALGYRIPVVRTLATVAGSSLAGLAGAMLVCGPLGLFVQNVTAGRGWVALALVVFARWRPGRAVAGALLFGLCDAAQLRLQGTATEIPYEVFLALPYAVTLLALMVRARRSGTPAALAVPFVRGAR
ncbi:MAG TPA: ABC transporter permease [Pseudonocardia sp.]|jgi:simple sugar transport system permease protein|uniref:ABC transporter permease n=1 Tax=Pseudonocardia sp. TaxID=60912 RepID=UPI002B4B8D87|nr:ABC transporter permease [Pseudonocardia sp.]HLU55153.1 ABC transporter permease [Pseudonocardia sp.]